MRSIRSTRGRLMGGSVLLTMIITSLAVATVVLQAASPRAPQVPPAPVPVASPGQRVVPAAPDSIAYHPAPMPVPTPPGNPDLALLQTSQAPALPLLGLPALLMAGLLARRLWRILPTRRMMLGARPSRAACQECAK